VLAATVRLTAPVEGFGHGWPTMMRSAGAGLSMPRYDSQVNAAPPELTQEPPDRILLSIIVLLRFPSQV